MAKQRYSQQQVIEAIRESSGIMTEAARRLGCSVDTIQNYVKRYRRVADAQLQARAGIIDKAESVLVQRLEAGEWDAAKFVLTTVGRDRGWNPKQEVAVAEPQRISLQLLQSLMADEEDIIEAKAYLAGELD